jgi:hypothetical protein
VPTLTVRRQLGRYDAWNDFIGLIPKAADGRATVSVRFDKLAERTQPGLQDQDTGPSEDKAPD